MGRPTKQCPKCGLLSALELERFDLSYKNFSKTEPEPEPTPTLDPPKRRRVNDDRDKLMFNAGRYAAGARDKVATDAHNVLQIVLESE